MIFGRNHVKRRVFNVHMSVGIENIALNGNLTRKGVFQMAVAKDNGAFAVNVDRAAKAGGTVVAEYTVVYCCVATLNSQSATCFVDFANAYANKLTFAD